MTEDEQLTAVIAGLKHMKARELRKHFASYLAGTDRCVRSEPLRIEIARRIQEEFYGLSLSEDDSRRLEEYAQGDCLLVGKKRHHLMAGTVLDGWWKGENHVVIVRGRQAFEYEGIIYPSLNAVAKAITGQNRNGARMFKELETMEVQK